MSHNVNKQATLALLKPKGLLAPKGEESPYAAAKRWLAEAVHDHLYEYRANHWRSHRRLRRRIADLNASMTTLPKVSEPTEQQFLSALRKEKYRRIKMAAWQVSLTPEIVTRSIVAIDAYDPGRVVPLRPRETSASKEASPPLAS
ncbi:hypothetical protein [Rhizobium sp.]|uniref:hypothetical protein n=1 Tax=Rhizobium sp. TaxID=391 RepID=UPI0034C6D858